MFRINKKNFFLIFFLITLYLPLPSEYIYLIYGFFLCFTLFLFRKKISITLNLKEFLPAGVFLIWCYGVIMGLLNHNHTELIFRNFAGMTMYLIYYLFFLYKINCNNIIRSIYKCSTFFVFFTLIVWILKFYGLNSLYSLVPFHGNFTGGGTNVLFSQELLIFISYGINLYKLFFEKGTLKEKVFNMIIVIISIVDVLLCVGLDGYLLALIVNTTLIIIAGIYSKFSLSKRNLIFLCAVFFIFIFAMIYSNYTGGIIGKITDVNDPGNRIRYDQIYLALKECTLFGNGLGATFDSFIRTSESGAYAMEVTYINLIHKFGVFSIVLFYSYIKIYFLSIKNIINKQNIKTNLFIMLSISFVFPSLSNPFLYGSIPIMLHITSLYILHSNYKEVVSK